MNFRREKEKGQVTNVYGTININFYHLALTGCKEKKYRAQKMVTPSRHCVTRLSSNIVLLLDSIGYTVEKCCRLQTVLFLPKVLWKNPMIQPNVPNINSVH